MQIERKHGAFTTNEKRNRALDRPKCRDVHLITRFLFICIAFLLIPSPSHSQKTHPQILILNSYHQGYEWSDNEIAGILSRLRQTYPMIEPSIEHMDAKRFAYVDKFLFLLKDYLASKYKNRQLDVVMVLDNPAMDMALRCRSDIFPGVPVVFAGVNDFSPEMIKGHEKITGVAEVQELAGTLELALSLHPRTREVLVVQDYTITGLATRRELERILPEFENRVKVRFTPEVSLQELLASLKSRPSDSLALVYSYARDSEGRNLGLQESTELLSTNCPVPLYAMHETRLGHGIVGGMLLTGRQHGEEAAEIALKILNGVDPESIPVRMSRSWPMFDYRQLVRFKIPESALPRDSIVMNRPVSFWEANRALLLSVSVVVGSLLVLLFGLSIALIRIRRAESSMRMSEERYRGLYDEAPVGYMELDTEGRITRVNQREMEILGYTAEEMVGQPIWNFVVEKEAEETIKAKLAGDKPPAKGLERTYRRKDGATVPVLIDDMIKRDREGRITGIRSTIQDITERKRAEEEKEKLQAQLLQAQKMESVGRLAGGVAHDFNNMLGVIIGHAELAMLKADPADPLSKSLQEILKASQRSADLVRQLLAFARKQTVSPKVLDPNDTVSGMLKMLRRLIGEDIDLAWMPGHDLWKVKMDPSQIDQILANLAVNARDAILGVGKLTIETANTAFDEAYCADHAGFVPGEYVLLAVSDNGAGISKEIREHLFEPFFTTKEVGKGTGLGLATIYGIVKQNEGFINVYSEPGEGTTFKIYIPRFESEVVEATQDLPDETAPRGTETVLLVEDEEGVLYTARSMLEALGYRVLTARTITQAMRQAGEHTGDIHLLITDVVMPEMNGRDLAERLTSIRPGMKTLFMSGYTANVIAHRGILEEGVRFIEKPFSVKDLAAKVRKVLDQG